MKKVQIFLLLITSTVISQNNDLQKTQINDVLDNWHKAASKSNFEEYFSILTDDAIFIGTDANENWNKTQFKLFAKPYFDKGKAWNFIPLERHIYFNNDKKIAWFDELLNTQMKICRGSGVLIKVNNVWKIKQYVLSMTIPNENVDEVVKIKTKNEDKIILKIK